MSKKEEFAKAAGAGGACAAVGAGAYGVIGGIGIAAGGSAIGITLCPFIAIGTGCGLAEYGIYRLGKQVGEKDK